MALTASAFAYTWSKWNAECGNDKVVIQAVEQLQNEPLLEVRHVERLHDLVTTKSPHGPRKSSASRTEKTLHLTLGVKSTPHTDRVYGSHMASFLNGCFLTLRRHSRQSTNSDEMCLTIFYCKLSCGYHELPVRNRVAEHKKEKKLQTARLALVRMFQLGPQVRSPNSCFFLTSLLSVTS